MVTESLGIDPPFYFFRTNYSSRPTEAPGADASQPQLRLAPVPSLSNSPHKFSTLIGSCSTWSSAPSYPTF